MILRFSSLLSALWRLLSPVPETPFSILMSQAAEQLINLLAAPGEGVFFGAVARDTLFVQAMHGCQALP
jgi:hypothetical protein